MSTQLSERRRSGFEIAAALASAGWIVQLVVQRPTVYTVGLRRRGDKRWQFYDAGTPEDAFNAAESLLRHSSSSLP